MDYLPREAKTRRSWRMFWAIVFFLLAIGVAYNIAHGPPRFDSGPYRQGRMFAQFTLIAIPLSLSGFFYWRERVYRRGDTNKKP